MMSKIKLGRNEVCSCGSGNKYKRCCLTTDVSSPQNSLITHELIQKSMLGLKNRVQDISGPCIVHDGELGVKMSEVILDLADDLLEAAETKPQYDSAIAITCIAWNLATANSAEYAKSLERGLNKIDDQLHQEDTLKIINALVKKKNRLYPDINRVILDYDLIGNKNNFHLNVVSTVSKEEVAELNL